MADLTHYKEDFNFLSELLCFVKEYLKKDASSGTINKVSLKNGIYTTLDNGRSVRIVVPNVEQAFHIDLDNSYFVGFIGNAKPKCLLEGLNEKLWEIDSKLIQEISLNEHIVAYVSGERSKGGDWGNLVLLKSTDGIKTVRSSGIHQRAVSEISPYYYTDLRIHRGKYSNQEAFTDQTIFVDYTDETPKRRVEIWK